MWVGREKEKKKKACDVELEVLPCFPMMSGSVGVWANTHSFLGVEERDEDFSQGSKVLNFHSFYLLDAWASLTSGKLISGKKIFTKT